MVHIPSFDVIILGGSYAGLSAAMSLGRSRRNVLIVDSGLPCNRQTPYSHNFITQDGEEPGIITEKAKAQVMSYPTVRFSNDLAVHGEKIKTGFRVTTQSNKEYFARKILFATGIKDILPGLDGFADCWGKSVIHCPYCHGYEVKEQKTGILANGDVAFHYAQLLRNLTKDLTIFTNGKSTLTDEQFIRIRKHNISVIEHEIASLKHENGAIQQVVFKDQSTFELTAIYARPEFEQHCKIPEMLGCEFTEQGYIKTDMFQKTTVVNVFACGDNSSPMRSVANAVATGNFAGAVINNGLAEEEF